MKKREMIKVLMMEKRKDNTKYEKKIRKLRNQKLGEIEGILGRNSKPCRELRKQVKTTCNKLRMRLKSKNVKKASFLYEKYGMKDDILDELEHEDRMKYRGANIFDREYEFEDDEKHEPCIVCYEDENIVISDEEAELLALGPKYNIRNKLDEELFLCEIEECVIKLRWEMMGDEIKKKNDDEAYKNIELFFTEEENEEINEEIREMEDIEFAKARMIFDPENLSMNLSKRRATDLKGNSRVIFPKRSKDFETEAKIEAFRIQALAEFRSFVAEKCRKGGRQTMNLSKNQEMGLKSLTQRVKNGEIVIVATDKSGKFAVMSRRAYEDSGKKHMMGDVKVGWDFLKEAQTRINGHVAMLAKIFKVGKSWDHQDRVRETIIGDSLSVCPISLLYKDHKGWKPESGTVPPTRHVAGGHVGMNLHLSELVSDILEPLVETIREGEEVISTEDLIANTEEVNEDNQDWHTNKWWGDKTEDNFMACEKCEGAETYNYDVNKPELCTCGAIDLGKESEIIIVAPGKPEINGQYSPTKGDYYYTETERGSNHEKSGQMEIKCQYSPSSGGYSMEIEGEPDTEGSDGQQVTSQYSPSYYTEPKEGGVEINDQYSPYSGDYSMETGMGQVTRSLYKMEINGQQSPSREDYSMETEMGQVTRSLYRMEIEGQHSPSSKSYSMETEMRKVTRSLHRMEVKGQHSPSIGRHSMEPGEGTNVKESDDEINGQYSPSSGSYTTETEMGSNHKKPEQVGITSQYSPYKGDYSTETEMGTGHVKSTQEEIICQYSPSKEGYSGSNGGRPEVNKVPGGPEITNQYSLSRGEHTTVVKEGGYIRTTCRFLRLHRRAKWEAKMGWDNMDKSRTISSQEANPEDLQDYSSPLVIIGSDVVSLYPNLKVREISERIKEAILESEMTWEEVDYLEAARYVALNWDKERCRRSTLRSIIPRRRGKTGSRPGISGAGPRGKLRGDQEQWIFNPKVKLTPELKKELLATVVSIATEQMFKHHFYTFGGEIFHQQEGGPIGLRGTCAVARVCMQMFDMKWKRKVENLRIKIRLLKRYMDDSRVILPPIKPGWRAVGSEVRFCMAWQEEDRNLSGAEITKRVLLETMKDVESYLSFTGEIGEEFEDGWLPTLDTNLKVDNKNRILFKYYEKETCTKRTVQRSSAMGENTKIQILSQDLIRRMMNSSELLGNGEKKRIIDQYTEKLLRSGYSKDQTRRIIMNGIKGYEGKRRRRAAEGRPMRSTAAKSRGRRYKEKLMGKSTWFRKRRVEDVPTERRNHRKTGKPSSKEQKPKEQLPTRSVIFVDNTEGGELATRMKDLMRRLSPSLGFNIKVVERNGSTLRSRFPVTNLWEGSQCGRSDCTTCNQGAEKLPQCTKTSVLYENICHKCNEGAGSSKELTDVKEGSIYIGESSRSIYERSKEHWSDWRSKLERSHILKHQREAHGGEEEPKFMMRSVRYFRSALSRQVGEAVRIMRRGGAGAILNSKSEFDRCKIPRLVFEEEEDEEEIRKKQEQDIAREKEIIEEQAAAWGEARYNEMKEDDLRKWTSRAKTTSLRRKQEEEVPEEPGKRRKKFKHSFMMEDWGEEQKMTEEPSSSNTDTPHPPTTDNPADLTSRVSQETVWDSVDRHTRQTNITAYVSVVQPSGTDVPTAEQKLDDEGSIQEDNNIFEDNTRTMEDMGVCTETQVIAAAGVQDNRTNAEVVPDNNTSHETNLLTTPSLREEYKTEVCTKDNRGCCTLHNIKMTKIDISSKVWGKKTTKGVSGYGWIYKKVPKYICKMKNTPSLRIPDINSSERFGDIDRERFSDYSCQPGVSNIRNIRQGQGEDRLDGVPEHSISNTQVAL